MSKLNWSVSVVASAEQVYAYATDTVAGPKWTIGLLKRELTTPGPLAVGSIWTETRRVAGTQQVVEVEITEHEGPGPGCEPPYRIAGKSAKLGVAASFLVIISALPEGGCRVDLSGEIEASSFFGKPIASQVRRKLEEQGDAPLQMLKQEVEALAAG